MVSEIDHDPFDPMDDEDQEGMTVSENSGWGPDLDAANFDKALLQARVDELEAFVMAEGECHISYEEFERLKAENEVMRDFCHSKGVTDGDIALAVAQR